MLVLDVRLPRTVETAEILSLADLHLGDRRHLRNLLSDIIRWVDASPSRYVALNGDLIDNAIRESVGDPYTATLPPQEQKKLIIETLKPLKDKILLCNVGNHEERSYKHGGGDPDEDIAMALDVPYGREGTLLRVEVGYNSKNGTGFVYRIYFTHGWAGGKRSGSALNAAEELEHTLDADAYVLGHSHKAGVTYKNFFRYNPTAASVSKVPHTFVSGGAIMEWGGYAERGGMAPGAERLPFIILDGKRQSSVEVGWVA